MRIDHVAFRTFNKDETAKFFIDAFGYKVQAEFEIFFNDEKTDKAICVALEPPEKTSKDLPFIIPYGGSEYHMAPEIFVSEGTPGSIVHNWVTKNGGARIHHIAFMVDSVEEKRKEWIKNGWGDFTSDSAFQCDDLTQIFTTPINLTGLVFEFIERKNHGFCSANVKKLMQSSVALDKNIP